MNWLPHIEIRGKWTQLALPRVQLHPRSNVNFCSVLWFMNKYCKMNGIPISFQCWVIRNVAAVELVSTCQNWCEVGGSSTQLEFSLGGGFGFILQRMVPAENVPIYPLLVDKFHSGPSWWTDIDRCQFHIGLFDLSTTSSTFQTPILYDIMFWEVTTFQLRVEHQILF